MKSTKDSFKDRIDNIKSWEDYHKVDKSLINCYSAGIISIDEYMRIDDYLDGKFLELVKSTGGYENVS